MTEKEVLAAIIPEFDFINRDSTAKSGKTVTKVSNAVYPGCVKHWQNWKSSRVANHTDRIFEPVHFINIYIFCFNYSKSF